jgi:hypothetical protein
LVLLLVGNALPLTYDRDLDEAHSAYRLLFSLRSPESWIALAPMLVPLVTAIGLGLLVAQRQQQLAAGIVIGAGISGYAYGIATFGSTLALVPSALGPKSGGLLFLTGCCAIGVGGLLASARAGGSHAEQGVSWPARAVAALGALGLVLGAVVPLDKGRGSKALVEFPGGYPDWSTSGPPLLLGNAGWWMALIPGLAAAVAFGAAFVGRRLDRRAAGGTLITLGAFALLGFVSLIAQLHHVDDPLGAGGYIGAAGAVAVAVAGAVALVGRRVQAASEPLAPIRMPSMTTRYLCAAAHLDERFAHRVIRQIVDERHRAIAPSPGIDLPLVIRHCLAARERTRARDLALSALVVPFLALALYAHSGSGVAILLVVAAAVAVGAVEQWVRRYRIVALRLRPDAYKEVAIELSGDGEERLRDAVAAAGSNVTVYSGYRPFVGSGYDVGGWAFAINVGRGRTEGERTLTPKPFEVDELYDAISTAVHALELDGLGVEDHLYVDGRDIRDDPRFVVNRFGRPIGRIDDNTLARFLRAPEHKIRHYRCIRIARWQGEVVLSIFLHFARAGQSLFAEGRYFLLAPLKEEYHEIDSLQERPTLRQRLEFALRAAPMSLLLAAMALPRVTGRIVQAVRRWSAGREAKKLIKTTPLFDYGATTSVRELAQSDRFRRYFQQVDREMYSKIVEREILDAFVAFLRKKDIDTSDFEERQSAILNYGVIVSGSGSLSAQSLAVGEQAKATTGGAQAAAATAARRTAKAATRNTS